MNLINQLTDHPALELPYSEELKNALLSTLETSPMEFGNLVDSAEGAFPTDVMTVLTELVADNEVSQSNGLWFLRDQQDRPQNRIFPEVNVTIGSGSDLPEPHPLDFDWRFTEHTLACLEKVVNARNGGQGAILGAPTLYKYLVDLGADVTLYDKNPGIVEHLRNSGYSSLNEVDLTRSLEFSPRFRWAIADPPWYTEHYEGFLSAASQLLLPAGKLFLSVLPRLTRASAAADRFSIIKVAKKIGFDLVDVKPGGLGYASPPFEIEALREEGLVVGNWRKGDLFAFVLSSSTRIESNVRQSNDEVSWKTILLGATTVRIKNTSPNESEAFSYKPASSSGTPRVRSVSRRSPARLEANVWTSRNVALVVSKPHIVSAALTSIAGGSLPTEILDRMTTTYGLGDREARQLREILELLLQDAGLSWN